MKNTSTAVERVKSLKAQISKEIESVKVDLAKQLNTACETLKLLKELGCQNVLADPQYGEFVHRLGSEMTASTPASRKRRRKSPDGSSVKDCIVKVLGDGKEYNVGALTTEVEKLYGGKVSKASINNGLQVLKKEKTIRAVSRGIYKKA